ncbi:glycosyltransferase [Microbacterium marinum]|uniref:glycosyltransferase n=1 Tax=Microbacterium marinum TaxID=421115 RepID=UPI0038506E78
MTDLVVVSLEAWDGVWRRNQHLVWRLLQRDPTLRVLFVEPPADPLHDLRSRQMPRFGADLDDQAMSGRLWTFRPVKALPRRVDRRADDRIAAQICRAAEQLGMDAPILWVNDPLGAELARRTGWRTLYDITDDWLAADRADTHRARISEAEHWLLSHSRTVVACSAELVRRKSAGRPSDMPPIALIPNAVDVAAYCSPQPRPSDLPTERVALYAGTLHSDRLDVPLCVETAHRVRGSGTLVLIGPNALTGPDTAALRAAGARLLGARPHEELIGYLQHADVLLVPHLVNDFTESLDPIKLYEYLAVGRPIVSTPVAGFRDTSIPALRCAAPASFAEAVVAQWARSAEHHAPTAVKDWSVRAGAFAEVLAQTQSDS